jgi:hypothetical protein
MSPLSQRATDGGGVSQKKKNLKGLARWNQTKKKRHKSL